MCWGGCPTDGYSLATASFAHAEDYVLVSNSFLLLVVRHLLLEAMHLFLVASCS